MTQNCEMKLLGSVGSAFVTRILFVFKLKSIEYEYIEVDQRNKSELLLKSNPTLQRVPVLLHADEHPISESLVIMEYLDEIRPDIHPLLPSNPSERAQCRLLAYTFDTLCYPWMKEFMITREAKRREELTQLIIGGYIMLEEAFEKLSKGKAFFGGDDIGYMDIVVGSFLGWTKFYATIFNFNAIEEDRNPKLTKWEKSMWSHEVARSVIPNHETHMDFLNMIISKLPSLPDSA
ncbi:hypothetical protein SSX86_024083 [Deinandra increscens subsp. villosa]|uniref:Glutathione S-transferase n=1 Tax=Deinandra increscens subsp. villosa TaxID=3103831 RepID=A0AAP0CMF9_9ASTR